MARGVHALLGFNAGELSPLMDARTDQDKYNLGCKTLQNMVCTVQGPAVRRGGTRYVARTKENKKVWLSRFQFNRNQSYILEWGDGYVRFYTQRGQLQNNGVPYEIFTPWTYSALTTDDGTFALQFVQSADVVYITHSSGLYPRYKLSRLGATDWTLKPVDLIGGPFQDVDPNNDTITVTPDKLGDLNIRGVLVANTNVTLTANTAIFQLAHVGSLFKLEIIDYSGYPAWNVGVTTSVGDMRQFDGNVYQALDASTYNTSTAQGGTGKVPPTHLEGTQSDGNIRWLYMHSGYGWIQITGFSSGTVVNGVIKSRLPGAGGSGGVDGGGISGGSESPIAFYRYAFQVFNGVDGFEQTLDFYKGRLGLLRGRNACFSSSGIFEDFTGKTGFQVLDNNAINIQLGLKELDAARCCSGNRDFFCLTDTFEFTVENQSQNLVFSPTNVKVQPQTNVGTRLIQPIEAANATIYAEASGKRLREAKYDYQIDRYKSEDISILAEHITERGIVDFALQKDHDPVIWCALADGTLGATTYNRDRNVIGWHHHVLGGFNDVNQSTYPFVMAVETIASPDLSRDDVWMAVERVIDGQPIRTIEFMDDWRLADKGQQYAYYMDCGVTYNGDPVNVISGLDWLELQHVQVLADGGLHRPLQVRNHQITLDYPASVISIGLQYTSVLQTMRMEFGAQDGSAQTRAKTTAELVIRLFRSMGGAVGLYASNMFPMPMRPRGLAIGSTIPLFTGDVRMDLGPGWDTDGYVFVMQEQPLPLNVVALYPRITTND